MVTIMKDGVKIGDTFWPYAEYEDCAGCKFKRHYDEIDGQPLNRDICKMTPADEDKFLFGDMPEDKIPPCMKE